MRRERRRRALLGVALAALLAGLVVAIVAVSSSGGHSKPRPATTTRAALATSDLSVAAHYLGMSAAQLRGELAAGKTLAEVAAATPGKSTGGLENALVGAKAKRIEAQAAKGGVFSRRERARLNALRRRARRELLRRKRGARRGLRAKLALAAHYLNVPPEKLLAEVGSGRSLAQIASSKAGSSTTGLIDALVAARKKLIVAAAASGRISKASEAALLASLHERVTEEVHTP